jgi:hypothetical protein
VDPQKTSLASLAGVFLEIASRLAREVTVLSGNDHWVAEFRRNIEAVIKNGTFNDTASEEDQLRHYEIGLAAVEFFFASLRDNSDGDRIVGEPDGGPSEDNG